MPRSCRPCFITHERLPDMLPIFPLIGRSFSYMIFRCYRRGDTFACGAKLACFQGDIII